MISVSDHPRFAECWDRKAAAYNLLAQKMIEFDIDIKYLRDVTDAAIEVGKIFQEHDSSEDQEIFFKLGYMLGQDPEKFSRRFKKAYNEVVNSAGNPDRQGMDNQVAAGR